MAHRRCLNCDTAFADNARFCAQCGQRADTARLHLGDLLRELLQRFVDVERGPLTFARALLTRPGAVAREYVEGRRRRHYGPFATLAVVVGVTALAVNLSGFQLLAQDGLPAEPAGLMQRHFNLLLLAQLPLLGGVCALVFRSARLTWAEHMALCAYTLSVRAVAIALVSPLAVVAARSAPTAAETAVSWLLWYLYFGWAASQFYAGPRWRSAALGIVAAALGHAAIMLLVGAASRAYLWVAGGG